MRCLSGFELYSRWVPLSLQCGHSNRDNSQVFFCKRTNNIYIHKFEGFFLRSQVSSNDLKVFNGCIV